MAKRSSSRERALDVAASLENLAVVLSNRRDDSNRNFIGMTGDDVRRIDVFFYGLFMDDALLREKGIDPKNRRVASVDNFSLLIGARATLIPRAGHKVFGVLFSLTHAEVDNLYSESSVSAYRPEAVLAQLADGIAVPSLCFNLPAPPSTDERNPQYASKLREVATRIGLPPDYVSSIY